MSESFEIHASETSYQVEIAGGLLEQTVRGGDANRIYLCDARLIERAKLDPARTIPIEATEQAKDLANFSDIVAQLKTRGANRQTVLCAIGGGVVQDIACFAASIYMRGLEWIYFPTTLLGMVDSCIGGKSSINVGGAKNLVGTFHPPERVCIDPVWADSLPLEQKIAGLLEAAKICFARENEAFERYLALSPSPEMHGELLEPIISLSLRTKKWFIETDEFDRNERQLLNFGHTFGHAIEAATDFAVSHGIAVGMGMLCALQYGQAAGDQRANALKAHITPLLAQVPGLTAAMATFDAQSATEKFTADKKHDAQHYWIIAPDEAGYLRRVPLPKTPQSLTTIRDLFSNVKELYG